MNKDMHQNDELTIKETLDQAATAIKDGEIALGKSKLELVLQREPNNVLAWLWMSRCFQDRENRNRCLRKVLEIDPNNKHALESIRAISLLEQSDKERPVQKTVDATKEDSLHRTGFQDRGNLPMTNSRKDSSGWKWLFLGSVGTFFTIVIVGLIGFRLDLFQNKSNGTDGPSSQNIGFSESTIQGWEYKLDIITYDTICAVQALEPYANTEVVKDWGSADRYGIAFVWNAIECWDADSPEGVLYKILGEYVNCGYDYFSSHVQTMGELGWEIVSYDHAQYTSSGTQYCSSKVIDYGYEIMWKRLTISE